MFLIYFWCPCHESNMDLDVRSVLFCPLNYKGRFKLFFSCYFNIFIVPFQLKSKLKWAYSLAVKYVNGIDASRVQLPVGPPQSPRVGDAPLREPTDISTNYIFIFS